MKEEGKMRTIVVLLAVLFALVLGTEAQAQDGTLDTEQSSEVELSVETEPTPPPNDGTTSTEPQSGPEDSGTFSEQAVTPSQEETISLCGWNHNYQAWHIIDVPVDIAEEWVATDFRYQWPTADGGCPTNTPLPEGPTFMCSLPYEGQSAFTGQWISTLEEYAALDYVEVHPEGACPEGIYEVRTDPPPPHTGIPGLIAVRIDGEQPESTATPLLTGDSGDSSTAPPSTTGSDGSGVNTASPRSTAPIRTLPRTGVGGSTSMTLIALLAGAGMLSSLAALTLRNYTR